MYWLPRILGIVMVLFLAIFAADAVGEGVLAVFMHLVPAYILAIVFWVSWRSPKIGGPLYMLLGVWYIFGFGSNQHWTSQLILGGIPILIGALFYFGSVAKRELPILP